ncbi:synaptic vesicle transporter [Aspergillus saccharolyticus JOP 1030-1]|uniref:Synaptic vesicle transporter n=1 Tax=Aspergillus saccharolyticus JOP 1030-1 TaxID=1450539 RepID=A0A319AHW3_9EURO|nr:synaptic vesicle transporter [Aspergillus saccharolyticus JOP 1030-1]PYH46222.1 synaptic vesicle transporter [Aspergillus saccharolyticus JOP 1030-1]
MLGLQPPSVASSEWARVRKELLFATIVLGSCADGTLGPVLVPGFVVVAADLQVSLTSVTLLNGSLVMALGVSSYVCSPLATCFGKRPVYLCTTLLVLASCCWAAASRSYTSLLASRVFQGLGMGAFLSLAGTSSINEVFLEDERGVRVGLWNFAFIVCVNLTPVISGYVISSLSWRWAFWLEAILFGGVLVATILFFPETTTTTTVRMDGGVAAVDDRIPTTPPDTIDTKSASEVDIAEKQQQQSVVPLDDTASVAIASTVPITTTTQKLQALSLALVSPLAILLHPVVLWGCIMWSVTFTWTILLGAVASQIFTAPPYNMSTIAVGNLTGLAPGIGSALGTVLGGWLCDWTRRLLSRAPAPAPPSHPPANSPGTVDPESRLPVLLPATITMAVGAFGLGAATERGDSAVVCGVFMAILNFAVGMGCTGIVAYTNDVCAERAGDAFGLAMLMKSALAFGLTFVWNDYLGKHGPLVFFSTFGALSVGVMLTSVPLFVWGKRVRRWADGWDLLRRS